MAPEFYLAVVTMHGTIMVFFFISYVLVSGFGNYLVPLQVGARDMAFPFLNMLSTGSRCVMTLSPFFVQASRGRRLDRVIRRSARCRGQPGRGLDRPSGC
jgi:heme/copper-type cytochrome/quinol oxidase subunit 1